MCEYSRAMQFRELDQRSFKFQLKLFFYISFGQSKPNFMYETG